MSRYVTTSEDIWFILISAVAKDASQHYASIVQGTVCKNITRHNPAQLTDTQKEIKLN